MDKARKDLKVTKEENTMKEARKGVKIAKKENTIKSIKIFNKEHTYNSNFFVDYKFERDIKVIEELTAKIREPHILSYVALDTIRFFVPEDYDGIGDSLIRWIYNNNKKVDNQDIRECLLALSTEDTEWTKQSNKGRESILFRKITFNPDLQDKIISILNGYKTKLTELLNESIVECTERERQREIRKSKWKCNKIYKRILPYGGEDGVDGYIDADYISNSGDIVRMVQRDIFDCGTFYYPKRLETRDTSDCEYTKNEKELSSWLSEFGEFGRRIRM